MKNFLNIENLNLYYGDIQVLKNISFGLEPGELLCILGPSGCGKTSLLRSLAGFEIPSSGTITLDNNQVFAEGRNVGAEERKIGFVFQDLALFPHLTVEQNITFGLSGKNKAEKKDICDRLLEVIGLPQYIKSYPHELSGGQKQRVALARSLAPEPSLILLDEPFSSLDEDLAEELSVEFRDILKQTNMTAVMVTHNQNEAFAIADKVAVMTSGVMEQISSPEEIYLNPASSNIANFIGDGFFLDCELSTGNVVKTSLGEVNVSNPELLCVDRVGPSKIFVRPEQVLVSKDEQGSGVNVSNIKYFFKGDRYLATAVLDGYKVCFYTAKRLDVAGLSLNQSVDYKIIL